MKDFAKYLGQAFIGDSHLHLISQDFNKKPFCKRTAGGGKKSGRKEERSLESNQSKDTSLISS